MSSSPYVGPPLGARPLQGGHCRFRVWAPRASRCEVVLADGRSHAMQPERGGYFAAEVERVPPGAHYRYRLAGSEGQVIERPDPASRAQPEGVHGPSEVVPTDFAWSDEGWTGPPLRDYVIYELHVGAFSDAGTFDGVIPHLDQLRELGVTAVELMPVAQFPGERNWGYDGVYPFAAQYGYGGPEGLKRLVDACHARRLAVVLDVVYNHLGPEGNYLHDFGPYFTDRYHTPWGAALNFDGADSDEVRAFFLQNALQWVDEFHIDALRLDAVHAILDTSPYPFLEEVADAVRERARELSRRIHLIAESDANDPRLVRPAEAGGLGLDGVWVDDFHHALHALLTGERQGYYQDYGAVDDVVRAISRGFVYAGRRSTFRGRRHGREPGGVPPERFVVCVQNHDQVGNRLAGDRLTTSLTAAEMRVAAAAVLLSPYTPLLFMGEEYGETAPFPYFVSHGDPALVEAVREGRREEFASFRWDAAPPDPQADETFRSARLRRELREEAEGRARLEWYRELLVVRGRLGPITDRDARQETAAFAGAPGLWFRRSAAGDDVLVLLGFEAGTVTLEIGPGGWRRRLDSEEERFGGDAPAVPETVEDGDTLELRGPVAAVYTP